MSSQTARDVCNELEVPEVFDGLITIKNIVREPGERAKVAVESYDDRIDIILLLFEHFTIIGIKLYIRITLYGLRCSVFIYVTESNKIFTADTSYITCRLATATNSCYIQLVTWCLLT